MQWLQDPKQSNEYNLNNLRREATRHFRKNNKEYLNIRSKVVETCIGTSMILRRVTSLKLL